MSETIIEIERLTKRYGSVEAVKEVDLKIGKGEFFGLIGPNGAGKTTLFRMLLGLTQPTAGCIRVKGLDVSRVWSREVRSHTGYLPENIVFYDHMSGEETLRFFAGLKGVSMTEVPELLEKVGLTDAARRPVGQYSKGMRQRLGLAQALLGRPEILFLDEPTTGLDPEGIGMFYEILKEVKAVGVTIVMTSHILKEVQDRVDTLAIIGGGRVIAHGSVAALRGSLGLKSMMKFTCPGDGAPLERAIIEAGGSDLVRQGGRLVLYCAQEDKMKILRAALDAESHISDLELLEPSLEDVFMEYVGMEEGA